MDVLFSVAERGATVMANHLYSTLIQFFGFSIAREWIDRNPLDGITRDKIGGREQIRDRTRDKALHNRTSAVGSMILSGGAWTPHDLRRTGATLMGELGVMGEAIEKCLNHVEKNKFIRTYQRQELKLEQKDAWKRLGDRLSLLISSCLRNWFATVASDCAWSKGRPYSQTIGTYS